MKITGYSKTVLLIPLSCLLAAILGYLVPKDWTGQIIVNGALGICIFFTLGMGFQIWRTYDRSVINWGAIKSNKGAILLSLLLVFLYQSNDQRENKIMLDELSIQCTALDLLNNGTYNDALFSQNLDSRHEIIIGIPNKRPPLYSFLLSLVHRILGYHQFNGFILNGFLGVILFFIVAKIGSAYLTKFGIPIAAFSLATLPLLSQNITSQHFEVLYLVLISVLFLSLIRILQQGKENELPLSYLIATGIALTRYEGVIFFIAPWLVHLYLTLKDRGQNKFLIVYLVSPVVVVFVFCLIGYINSTPNYWQLYDFDHTQVFSLQYWPGNIGAFFDFMLTVNREHPVSLPLSMLGLASIPISILITGKELWKEFKRADSIDPLVLVTAIGLICMALFLGIVFSYHWGHVNSYETSRFLLFPFLAMTMSFLLAFKREPLLLLTVALLFTIGAGLQSILVDETAIRSNYIISIIGFSGIVCISAISKFKVQLPAYMVLFLGLYFSIETLSAISYREYDDKDYIISRTKTFLNWINEYSDQNILFVAESGLYGAISQESSASFYVFGQNEKQLLNQMKTNRFSAIFLLQETWLDREGKFTPREDWVIPETYVTETIDRKRINGFTGVRLLKLIDISEDESLNTSQ